MDKPTAATGGDVENPADADRMASDAESSAQLPPDPEPSATLGDSGETAHAP